MADTKIIFRYLFVNVNNLSNMQLEILLRQELGKKYECPTILSFLLTIGQ